jgi:hypothetical protein
VSAKIFRALLLSLLRCDGLPMPEDALIEAAQLVCRPSQPTDADLRDKLKTLEAEQYINGTTDTLTRERTWTLTDKGIHKARQL